MLTFNTLNDVLVTAGVLARMQQEGSEVVRLMHEFVADQPDGRWGVLYAEASDTAAPSAGAEERKRYHSTALVELRVPSRRRVHVGRGVGDTELVSHARAVFSALAELLEWEMYPLGVNPDPHDLLLRECLPL